VAPEGAGKGEAGEVGQVDAGAGDDGVNPAGVHLRRHAVDIHKVARGRFHLIFRRILVCGSTVSAFEATQLSYQQHTNKLEIFSTDICSYS
jgi:hypothetical protein